MVAHAHEESPLLQQARRQLDDRGVPYNATVQVGGMIEIPAAALALPMFMKRLDFLSLGTNDLIQYTLAIDRTDDAVAHLYDPLHPAVLHLISHTIQTANRGGVPVAVCGEMAGDAALTRLLRGAAQLSMHPRSCWRSRSRSCERASATRTPWWWLPPDRSGKDARIIGSSMQSCNEAMGPFKMRHRNGRPSAEATAKPASDSHPSCNATDQDRA